MKHKFKNLMKQRFAVVLAGILVFALCMTGIVAYLVDTASARNDFVIGGNRIEIEEGFIPPPELKPGISFTKNVKIKNVGPTDCYARVMAVFTTSDMEKYCEVDWNTEDWIYNAEDNYWYYPEAISTGEKTPSLFTKVTIKESYDFNGDGTIGADENVPESLITDFDIIVYAESYQSGEYANYQDAWVHYQANKPD